MVLKGRGKYKGKKNVKRTKKRREIKSSKVRGKNGVKGGVLKRWENTRGRKMKVYYMQQYFF